MVMIPDLIDLDENLDAPIPDRFADLAEELRGEGHDEPMVRKIVRAVGGTGFNLNLFPNVACSMAFFRVLRPVGVAETEIQHVAIGMGDAKTTPSPAGNRARLRLHEHFQGPMGLARQTMPRAGNASSAARARAMTSGSCSTAAARPPRVVRSRGIMRAMPRPRSACAPPISSGRG
jgi:hypothetical protein